MKLELILWTVFFAILMIAPAGFYGNLYILGLMITIFIQIVIASNWHLLFAYAGVWSFGQLAFFAIGGYASGILSIYLQLSPWLTMLLGASIAALSGAAIGLLTLRLRGIYLALATYGFQFVLIAIILVSRDITGGTLGLYNIPGLQIGSFSFATLNGLPYYYLAFALFLISTAVGVKIIRSRVGLAFIALRDSETRALSLGINPLKYRLIAFVTACFFTGLVGAFYGHYYLFIDPTAMNFDIMIALFLMMVIGGWGATYGPVLGGFIWIFVSEMVRPLGLYRFAIMGLLVIVLLVFAPSGLSGIIRQVSGRSRSLIGSSEASKRL